MNPSIENSVRTDNHHNSDETWQAFLAGDDEAHKAARETLFHRHSDLAVAMAAKYVKVTPSYKVDPDDLRSASYEGLLFAIDHFDPAAVVAEGSLDQVFRKYASRCIYGHMMDELTRQDTLTKYLREQVRQFRQQQDQLAQELGRPATYDELREALGYRDETRLQLLSSLADCMVNVEPLRQDEGGRDEPDELADKLVTFAHAAAEGYDPISVNDPYEVTELRMFQEQLQAAIATLPVLQQQLIHFHYYQD